MCALFWRFASARWPFVSRAARRGPNGPRTGQHHRPVSSAGGSTDILAASIAQHMQAKFGQPFIVQNKSGAGGGIGSAAVAKADPDGYTLLIGTGGSQVTGPLTAKNSPFDPDKDLIPVSLIAKLPSLLVVHPAIPAKTVPELMLISRRTRQDQLRIRRNRHGVHLAVELFQGGHRHADDACAVPQHGRQCQQPGRRPCPARHGHQLGSAAAGQWPDHSALAVTSKDRVASAPDIPTVGEAINGSRIGRGVPAGAARIRRRSSNPLIASPTVGMSAARHAVLAGDGQARMARPWPAAAEPS